MKKTIEHGEIPEMYFPTFFVGKDKSCFVVYHFQSQVEELLGSLEDLSERFVELSIPGQYPLLVQSPRDYFGSTSKHPDYNVLSNSERDVLKKDYESNGPHFVPSPFNEQPEIKEGRSGILHMKEMNLKNIVKK